MKIELVGGPMCGAVREIGAEPAGMWHETYTPGDGSMSTARYQRTGLRMASSKIHRYDYVGQTRHTPPLTSA